MNWKFWEKKKDLKSVIDLLKEEANAKPDLEISDLEKLILAKRKVQTFLNNLYKDRDDLNKMIFQSQRSKQDLKKRIQNLRTKK